jgi:AcrR family transcriptional regulator
MGTRPAVTSDPVRRRRRTGEQQERILAAAAELFSTSGYVATNMSEIGAAVGLTGGGLYRHFPSKEDLLGAIVRRAADEVYARVDEIVATCEDPAERLQALIANLVEACIRNRAMSSVLLLERRHVDAATQQSVDRIHRLHVAEWVHALAQLRPELSDAELASLVHQVWGALLWGSQHDSGLSDERLAGLLADSALAVVLGPGATLPTTSR